MAKTHLDETDRRLLAELEADGRLTQVALAARVGLSRTAVQERIARLEREGVIQGYTIRLRNPGAGAACAPTCCSREEPATNGPSSSCRAFPK